MKGLEMNLEILTVVWVSLSFIVRHKILESDLPILSLAELTRLMNAFTLVPNLHWIIVEDSR